VVCVVDVRSGGDFAIASPMSFKAVSIWDSLTVNAGENRIPADSSACPAGLKMGVCLARPLAASTGRKRPG